MIGLAENIGPASETYAGFAWAYLRRNGYYGHKSDHIPQPLTLAKGKTTSLNIRYETPLDAQAGEWGLECFEAPSEDGLNASVFWKQDVFPGALNVHYHNTKLVGTDENIFNLSKFSCHKQHFVKEDGTRITALKSPQFWLQIAGYPNDVEMENQPFSVLIDGRPGSRRRIDALRQLTSLSRNGTENFKLLGRQKLFLKLKNGLIAYDIRSGNGSYKDVAIALFGQDRVENEWLPEGCALKAKAIRVYKFGERMVAQDYQSLLPKKVI